MTTKFLSRNWVKRPDIALVALLVMIIFMMIIPLPTLLVDILIACNITISILMLMLAVYISNPMQFLVIPPILLIATLFRLSLSISTTRLILTEARAGDIIETFGQLVIGGSVIVGLVIFLIITIVQFIVITKGSERVAEVTARFALDGMPGKQMTIDADLRGELIDGQQARQSRIDLDLQMQLYASLDGAMKFVKGDAIAGLVITFVNLLGGLAIGVIVLNMPIGEAVTLYSVLTIGDGLVAQIPALFLSISAGIVVTRVSRENGNDLGMEIGLQLIQERRPLQAAAVILLLIGLIPGFPIIIFSSLSFLIGFIAYNLWRTESKKDVDENDFGIENTGLKNDAIPQNQFPITSTFFIVFSAELEPWANEAGMDARIKALHGVVQERTGIPFLALEINFSEELESNSYQFKLNNSEIHSGELPYRKVLLLDHPDYAKILGLKIETSHYLGLTGEAHLLDEADISTLEKYGISYMSNIDALCGEVEEKIVSVLYKCFNSHEAKLLLVELESEYPEMVGNLQESVHILSFTDIVQRLIQERIPLTDFKTIMEALLSSLRNNASGRIAVVEDIRMALGRQIYGKYLDEGVLQILIIDPAVEQFIRDCIQQKDEGAVLIMPSDERNKFVEEAKAICSNYGQRQTRMPMVLITTRDIRRHVWALLNQSGLYLPTFSYDELDKRTAFYISDYLYIDLDTP
jgi:type III secretion protein V